MDDEHTQSQPIEPTTPVEPGFADPFANPYEPHTDAPIGIPPPPPKMRRVSFSLIAACLVIAVLLFLSSGLFYLARTYEVSKEVPTPIVRFVPVTPTMQPTMPPTSTPTVRPYTAQDILNEMIAHNLRVDGPSYGESLAYFFIGSPYNNVVSIPFQGSVRIQNTTGKVHSKWGNHFQK